MNQGNAIVGSDLDIFFEQRFLINKIKFYKNQISILQGFLEMMVKYTVGEECMFEVEQYQNKFIVYTEVGDRLIKEYKMVRNKIREIEISGDETEKEKVMKFYKNLHKRTTEYFDFITTMSEDFLMFYSLYHKTDNHIF